MRVALILAAVAIAVLAVPVTAEPPQPGGHCEVQEEYVTEASLGHSPDDPTSLPMVQPGAKRPVECYY